jgi:hypothetical protein
LNSAGSWAITVRSPVVTLIRTIRR